MSKHTYEELEEELIKLKKNHTKSPKEDRYKILFDSVPEMVEIIELIYNGEGKPIDYYLRDVNLSVTKLFNKTKEELLNKKITSFVGVIEDYWLASFSSVEKTGQPIRFKTYGVKFDKYYYISAWKISANRIGVSFTCITESEKAKIALKEKLKKEQKTRVKKELELKIKSFELIKTIDQLDKTAKELASQKKEKDKQAEAALIISKREKELRTNELISAHKEISVADKFFSLLSVDIPLIGNGEYFTKVHPTFTDILGYEEIELLENPIMSFAHPEDLQASRIALTELQQGIPIDNFLSRFRCKDESYRWFNWTLAPDTQTGLLYGVVQDITERKKIEEEQIKSKDQVNELNKNLYKSLAREHKELLKGDKLFSSLSIGIRFIGEGKYITKINPAFSKALGYDEKELLENPFLSFVHPNDVQPTIDAVEKLQQSTETANLVNRYRCKDNSYLWFNWTVALDIETGLLYGVVQDITELKKMEKELILAKEHAEKLVDFKNQFLANMSHEIRTPLNGVIGFTKILLRNEVTKEQKHQLAAIKTSSDILLVLINDILDLAKIEAGKMTLETTELKVPNLVNSLLSTFELRLKEKEHILNTYYDKSIPEVLLGDPVRMNQILLNLISNAIKFTENGGTIDIRVNLLKQDEEKAIIEISVSDTGIGIKSDQIKKIFAPFTQSSIEIPRKYGGSGLGLNIVNQLIDLMKGSISVKSKLNVGSTFKFTLPLTKTTKSEKIVSNNKKLKRTDKMKVLIVDDVLINQYLAQTILHDFGFESDTAENGKIAIKLLEKNNYDIILMDLQMPKMNGWEATRHIRSKMRTPKSTIPIIALTADVTNINTHKCKEAGMDEYVSKPINETDLLNKIIRLVKEKKRKRSDPQIAAAKICNLEYLKSHSPNDSKFVPEMVQMILKQTPLVMQQINKCLANADWNGMQIHLHKIKPTLNLMGLHKDIISIAQQIEEYARKQENLNLIPALLMKIENTLEEAYKELEEEM